MLETVLYPSVWPSLTRLEREARSIMSEKKYSERTRDASKAEARDKVAREHKYGRNSAEDPAISSSRSDRRVQSNARDHPRAELQSGESVHASSKSKHASNHVQNHISEKSHDSSGKRKRSSEDDEEDVWTEHVSSSGRIYYYNKKLDKSQWEKPKGCIKKLRQDSAPSSSHKSKSSGTSQSHSQHSSVSKPTSTSTSTPTAHATKHLSQTHPSSSSTSKSSRDTSHRGGHGHSHSHSHSERERVKSHSIHGTRERGHTHTAHPHTHHHHSSSKGISRSRSHSGSVSPMGAASKSSSGSKHRHGERSHDKTPSRHSRSAVSHSNPSASRPAHNSLQTSPTTPMNLTTPGSSIISPKTPGLPVNLTQTLSATQQIIEQTSIILEQQQKIFTGDHVTPIQSNTLTGHSFTPTHSHPHVRQKLVFSQPSNGPSNQDSASSTPLSSYQPGSNTTSPQSQPGSFMASMDSLGLHPLQKALLLQNQFSQQLQDSTILMDPSTGISLPVVIPSALPPHFTTQHSLPSSPLAQTQSPIPIPTTMLGTQTAYIPGIQPLPQQVVYIPPMNQLVPYMGAHEARGITGGARFIPVNSPSLQRPMSRLGYPEMEAHHAEFPDSGVLESLPQLQVDSDYFNRGLVDVWWNQSHESLQKQIDSSSSELLSRTTSDTIYLSGKVAKSQLALETTQVRTKARNERIVILRKIMAEIERR